MKLSLAALKVGKFHYKCAVANGGRCKDKQANATTFLSATISRGFVLQIRFDYIGVIGGDGNLNSIRCHC